jgi:hypothetical protein
VWPLSGGFALLDGGGNGLGCKNVLRIDLGENLFSGEIDHRNSLKKKDG